MVLHSVILCTILAFSLASTEQCVSSAGSSIDLSLHSMKNASGHWITKVETRRLTTKESPREFSLNVQQETRTCGRHEIEQMVSVTLHDTSMPGAIEPSTARPTTMTATSTTTTPPTTTITTITPKSCPHSGYQLYPEFNCYKAFPSRSEWRTWSQAREQCVVIETERERQDVYIPLWNTTESWNKYQWVGVYIPEGEDGWTTVNGEPALSTWWAHGYPLKYAARKCALADPTGLLANTYCEVTGAFISEISL